MAKSISEEELQFRKRARRRLVGAIALVTIVVVFLPMVLDSEPKPVSQDISIQIPSPNAGNFISKIVPSGPGTSLSGLPNTTQLRPATTLINAPAGVAPAPPPSAPVAAAPTTLNAAPAQSVKEADTTLPTGSVAQSTAKSAPTSKTTTDKPESKKSVPVPKMTGKTKPPMEDAKIETKNAAGFVVQIAALNDAAKATQLQEQITAAGIKAYTETVPTAKGKVTRVRAGPFKTREEAEKTRDKLKSMNLSGNVVPK